MLSPLAFVVADLLIYWSGFEVDLEARHRPIVIGYVVIGVYTDGLRQAAAEHRLEWKSAVWLPVWLIGLGIISWQGRYDGGAKLAPVNTNNIPFWWDIVVVAAFSLAIYYWAMYTKLPRDKMLALVAVQQSEPEPSAPTFE